MIALVQYGRMAHVARAACGEVGFARGDRVVLRVARGLELATVLCEVNEGGSTECEVLRHAAPDDFAAAERNEAFGQDILASVESDLPIHFIDVEVSLDRKAAVLHALPFGECDASPLLAELSERFGLAVRLLDLSRSPVATDPPDPEKMTCGKPDCGSGSGCSSCSTGGCSTGSCSRGSVKSAADLTAYFADLRSKMEAARVPLV